MSRLERIPQQQEQRRWRRRCECHAATTTCADATRAIGWKIIGPIQFSPSRARLNETAMLTTTVEYLSVFFDTVMVGFCFERVKSRAEAEMTSVGR